MRTAASGGPNTWHIGELAARLGLNPKTIRYYETLGLLPTPPRTAAGYRVYDAADDDRLRFILKAKALDLSLEEIRDILALRDAGQTPCVHVVALLDAKLAALDAQLRALQELRGELAGLRQGAAAQARDGAWVCAIIEFHEPPPRTATHPRIRGRAETTRSAPPR